MKKIAKLLLRLVKLSFSTIFFFTSVVLIIYVTYFLGHRVLEAGMLGGDTPYHLALMHALDRFYPKIPIWFPFAGAGSSLVLGYWVFSYYLAIAGSHLTSMSMEQWVRLLEFLVVPIICIEIYIYLWVRLKNQVIAALGAFMYPLSSMAWGWIAHAGFFAMHISGVFYIPALLFFDLYLENDLVGSDRVARKRLYLLGFFVTLFLGILTHGSFFPSFFLGLPLYALLRSQLFPRIKEKRLNSAARAVKITIITAVIGLLAGAFFIIPQARYFSNQPFTPTYGPTDTPYLFWKAFLGFERLSPFIGSLYTPLFMSVLVSIFAILGTVFGLIRRRFIGALGATAFFYIWWLSSARWLAINVEFLRIFILPTSNRSATVVSIYLTILAAYGMWSLADLPGSLLRYIGRKVAKADRIINVFKHILFQGSFVISAFLALGIFIWSFYNFRSLQSYPTETGVWGVSEAYFGYGSLGFPIPYCIVPGLKNEVGENMICQDYLPRGVIDHAEADFWSEDLIRNVKDLQMDQFTRVSISPYLGKVTFSFAKHSDASMVSAPSGQSVINLEWLGVHDKSLFLEGEVSAKEVEELAKWFGIKYAFFDIKKLASISSRYPEDVWPLGTISGGIEIREYTKSSGIANVSSKPAVLVIGSNDKQAYVPVLRLATKGVLSYDKALLVEGRDRIDDYSKEELDNFSLIVLHGYSYKNKEKAWNLLKGYVRKGGSLFVDTGWQYVDKDWGKGPDKAGNYLPVDLLEPLPISETSWGNIGTSWTDAKLLTNLGRSLDVGKFGALSWNNKPWGMALAKHSDLEPWAEPVLTMGDNIIIARGTFGEGRVVWSGMNIFVHAYDKESKEEYELLENMFGYLIPESVIETGRLSANWDDPDKVEFVLTEVPRNSYLYFAETYTSNWKAYLVSNRDKKPLKIYRAGPRFMAVKLFEAPRDSKVVFEYDVSSVLLFSFGISLTAFLLIALSIADNVIFNKGIELKLRKKFSKIKPKALKSGLKRGVNEEIYY